MLTLPPKFKQALGNGTRTSLYPLVRIYKGVQIDDSLDSATEVINLSIKETNIGSKAYKGLLLNSPSISSKADIINNKYTISSVSLSISNAPYNGKIFSDDIPSLLNAVVQVYYAANGLETLDDCLLVYTGTIRRYSQSAETLNLTLEDLTEQKLKTQIPATLIEDTNYKEKYIGKPFPMTYGKVDKSPTVFKGLDTIVIDKPNKPHYDVWYWTEDYVSNIGFNHPLTTNNIYKAGSPLRVYKDGYLELKKNAPLNWGSFNHNNLENQELFSKDVSDGQEKFVLNTETFINTNPDEEEESEIEDYGIPTRIHRPIINVSFYVRNIDSTSPYESFTNNKFIGYFNDDGSMQTILHNVQHRSDSSTSNNGSPAKEFYDSFWQPYPTENEVLKFWEPTNINKAFDLENTEEIKGEIIDENWKTFYENNEDAAKFNVNWIQNNDDNSGLHISSSNYNVEQSGGFARLHLNENVAEVDCVTKIYYNSTFFTNGNFNIDDGGNDTHPMPVNFWISRNLDFNKFNISNPVNTLDDFANEVWYTSENPFPATPNSNYQMDITERATDLDTETQNNFPNYGRFQFEDRFLHSLNNYNNILQEFNTTNAVDSIQWGANATLFPYVRYQCANLTDIYVMQDALIKDYSNLDYYCGTNGRQHINENGINSITESVNKILKDILEDELIYSTNIDESSASIQYDDNNNLKWKYAFTLNEQKEAKEIFEGLFKSSLLIPSFNTKGEFKFIGVKQIINNYNDVIIIDNSDVLKYSFSFTKLEDVKNQINVKYKKDYGSGDYSKETGFKIEGYNTYDELTTNGLGYDANAAYNINYYGLNSEDSKLEFESEYIRDKSTALRLQKRLLMWYCNQHLITKIDLPPSYMNLEAGDYIKFSELLGNKLAFGYNYTTPEQRNGQLIYDVFFVTKVSKSLSKVSIEAVQVHRGEYGYPSIAEEDTGNIINGNGEDVTENNQIPDEGDLSENYPQDDTEEETNPYLKIQFAGNTILNDGNIIGYIETNQDETWDLNIWAKNISNTFTYNGENYNEQENIPLGEVDASDLVDISITMQNDNDAIIMISKKIDIYPLGSFVEFVVEVKNTEDLQDIDYFTQFGIEEPEPSELIGDVTGDGVVNVLDVVTIVNMALGFQEPNDEADINNDGIINVLDMVQLVGIILEQ